MFKVPRFGNLLEFKKQPLLAIVDVYFCMWSLFYKAGEMIVFNIYLDLDLKKHMDYCLELDKNTC